MALTGNIKTDYLAVGDGIMVQRAISIALATPTHVNATVDTWLPGDVGKPIFIGDAGAADGFLHQSTILTVTDARNIILSTAANLHILQNAPSPGTPLVASLQWVAWGTDDSPAFKRWNDAAKVASGLCKLIIPADGAVYILADQTQNVSRFCRFIAQCEIEGSMVLTGVGAGTGAPTIVGNFNLGAITMPNISTTSGLFNTARRGDTFLQLKNISNASRFQTGTSTYTASDGTVYTFGNRLHITAFDLQAFGDPNLFYREFNTGTANLTTGRIDLGAPLLQDYLDTFPTYNAGDAFSQNCGGPATVYAFDATWDASVKVTGVKFWKSYLTFAQIKTFQAANCTWLDPYGPCASCNQTYIVDRCNLDACYTEADKSIDTMIVRNGTRWHRMWFQSSCVENLSVADCAVGLQGTPKNCVFTGNTFDYFQVGTEAYGRTESIIANNNIFPSPVTVGVVEDDITAAPHSGDGGKSLVNGIVKGPHGSPTRWGVPETHMMFKGQRASETSFMVLDGVTQDGSNTLVPTDLSGSAFPSIPLSGGNLQVMAHPCWNWSGTGNTGSKQAVSLSRPGAQKRPIRSHAYMRYVAAELANPIEGFEIWGKFTSLRIKVITAFTTSGALSLRIFAQFAANYLNVDGSLGSTYGVTIDLKTAGERLITFSNVSGSVGADVLGSAPGLIWMAGAQVPYISGAITGGDPGVIEFEMFTDFGKSRAMRLRNAA